jgi:hypothetical protein
MNHRLSTDISGRYNNHQVGLFSANLTLNKDSSFVYEKIEAEVRAICKGHWQRTSKDVILLNGKDTWIYQNSLDSALFPRFDLINEKVIILNTKKIKHGKIILKKL